MPQFPTLKSGATVQYPLERSQGAASRVLRFIDGAEQRFVLRGSPLRRWVVRLDFLDEDELRRVEDFVKANRGRAGTFSFTDPIDGGIHPTCCLNDDEANVELVATGRGRVALVIREVR